jgi:5-oxoprolinase (ATP-hydrolysing)
VKKLTTASSNLTFGAGGKDAEGKHVAGWGYYEVRSACPGLQTYLYADAALAQTIAGGSGAGPGWNGTSGVHTHITNTRIGDAEVRRASPPPMSDCAR